MLAEVPALMIPFILIYDHMTKCKNITELMLIQCTRKKKIMTLFYTECRCVSTDMVAREPPGALLAAEKKEKKTHQSTWHCLSYSFFSFLHVSQEKPKFKIMEEKGHE